MPMLVEQIRGRAAATLKACRKSNTSTDIAHALAAHRQQLACRSESSNAKGTRHSSADSCTMGCSGWLCMAAGGQQGGGEAAH
jgi:hypothetical protein